VLDKARDLAEQLGLTLHEAKNLLVTVQRHVLNRQIDTFLASRVACPTCGRPRGVKDHKTIVFRTVFGKLELASPRLRRCPCQRGGQASTSPLVELLPEHTAPELLYLESKWSSLISYGVDRQGVAGLPAGRHDLERFHCAARHPAGGPSPGRRTRTGTDLPARRLSRWVLEPAGATAAHHRRP
jgi:hypothetical protein